MAGGILERVPRLCRDRRARGFPGNYSAYRVARDRQFAAEATAYERHRQEVARLQEFVRRQVQRADRIQRGPKRGRDYYGWVAKKIAKRAHAARGRLERLKDERPPEPHRPDRVHLDVPSGGRVGPTMAHLRGVEMWFEARPLFSDVTVTLGRGERVGLVGANGSGKTTLLRLLAGELLPSEGEVWVGPGVRIGYLPQIPLQGMRDRKVIDVTLDAGLGPTESRAVLGALLFRGDRIFQPIDELSGGERTRLALLELIAKRSNVLLLDERTNHLDLPSRERLEETLDAYEGTVVIASHDRYLLDRLCAVIWAIAGGTVSVREGRLL